MNMIRKGRFIAVIMTIHLFFQCAPLTTTACTRAVFLGSGHRVMTGRTMDWEEDMRTDLWLFPRGIKRTGEAGLHSAMWTSKYGSVIASVYNLASADGMNEKGLVMNMLYLAESDYGKPKQPQSNLSISLWGQYALDNFATVDEAVSGFQAQAFNIIAPRLPTGQASTVHLSLSDRSGDSAILEYVDGQLVIHHGRQYQVMTNSPIYSKQLALNDYWQEIGGSSFLPGTSRAADRFVRASFFINAIPKQLAMKYIQAVPKRLFDNQVVAGVMSVMRAVSVPFGLSTPNEPNIASTLWRTVSDQKRFIYFFESSTEPNTFWVEFEQLNFKVGQPIRKLALSQGQFYAGEVSAQFKPAQPFHFLPAA